MLKRNEGYALSYVLVVLLVLCAIAITVMSVSLNNLKNQQASIDRMVDKYDAQGLVEQVVAQLENSTTAANQEQLDELKSNMVNAGTITDDQLDLSVTEGIYKLTVNFNSTTIITEFTLDAVPQKDNEGNELEGNPIGYHVIYTCYNVEVTP